jgi:23S rRNA (guanosine2251-2'-O)-methyltransferase
MKNIEKETKTADLDVLQEQPLLIEGRNAVLEAFRSGKPVDKLFVLDGCQDGPIRTIIREAKKHDVILNFVGKGTAEPDFRDRKAPGGHRFCGGL